MKVWKDMTPEEKGALLLAHHEGKEIEYWYSDGSGWQTCFGNQEPGRTPQFAYRIKPEPKFELVEMGVINNRNGWQAYTCLTKISPSHRITFNLIDGVPDCSSIKMEKL